MSEMRKVFFAKTDLYFSIFSYLDIIAIKQDLEDYFGRKVDVVTENSISPYIKNEFKGCD